MGIVYSKNLNTFASQVVWFMTPEKALDDKNFFLVHLMARGTQSAYKHARDVFKFTDEDFITALKNAPAGIFMYEEQWLKWNKLFGINPPLPFPKKW